MSGDPEQEYFADGITEDLLTALSRIRWLFVIARNSTFVFKGRPVGVKEVGRQLVHYGRSSLIFASSCRGLKGLAI